MEWQKGDIVDVCIKNDADGIAFTANSVVLKSGELCIGAGAAKRVKNYFPASTAMALGKQIHKVQTRVQPDYHLAGITFLRPEKLGLFYIFALQVKRDYRDDGDLDLTVESLKTLAEWCAENPDIKLVLNCPLIGLGGFVKRAEEVKGIVEDILRNTNVVVTIL